MTHHKWTQETLFIAMEEVKEGKTSLRQAAIKYDIKRDYQFKNAERERKRAEKEVARGQARASGSKGRGKGGKSGVSTRSQARSTQPATASTSTNTPESGNEANDCVLCPSCGEGDETRLWVQCDSMSCQTWYHFECTDIDPEEYNDLDAITWFCDN